MIIVLSIIKLLDNQTHRPKTAKELFLNRDILALESKTVLFLSSDEVATNLRIDINDFHTFSLLPQFYCRRGP